MTEKNAPKKTAQKKPQTQTARKKPQTKAASGKSGKKTGAKKQKETGSIFQSSGFKAVMAVAFCLLVLLLAFTAYDFGYRVFNKKGMEPEPGRQVEIVVEQGDSTMEVGALLEEKGLIESKWVFLAQKLFYGTGIYPNTYELNTSMSAQEILKLLNVMPMAED